MRVFNLPDLGEGLPDAEIVQWLVAEGDQVKLDQPMVSMETAKAVVEVPSPLSGRIHTLHGKPGDIIDTGKPLVTFDGDDDEATAEADDDADQAAAQVNGDADQAAAEVDGETDQAAAEADGDADQAVSRLDGDADEAAPSPGESDAGGSPKPTDEHREDSNTVVGSVPSSDRVVRESPSTAGGVKATPATRALAKKLKVDLTRVSATGSNGVVTIKDVKKAAEAGAAKLRAEPAPGDVQPPRGDDQWSELRGTRRTMARAMATAHAQVVPTTLSEDADVAAWEGRQDLTVRLIRALVAGVRREPSLNAWFDGEGQRRLIHVPVHAGIAVDTEDGLFVVALRDAGSQTPGQLRERLALLREQVADRSVPADELDGYTIVLSNFGIYGGKYASPVVSPPCVAILASGRMRDQVVAAHGGIAIHPVIPLSLTFDHRAVTGGEAARFLAACIEDLALPY